MPSRSDYRRIARCARWYGGLCLVIVYVVQIALFTFAKTVKTGRILDATGQYAVSVSVERNLAYSPISCVPLIGLALWLDPEPCEVVIQGAPDAEEQRIGIDIPEDVDLDELVLKRDAEGRWALWEYPEAPQPWWHVTPERLSERADPSSEK